MAFTPEMSVAERVFSLYELQTLSSDLHCLINFIVVVQ